MRCGLVLLGLVLMAVLHGCGESVTPLRVGSKDFTENKILAEMIAQLAEHEGIPVRRAIPFGDTFLEQQQALKRGDLDIHPEYNGTGLILLGQPPISDGDESFARVKALFAPLGLEWLERFGFSNDYVLVMRAERAAALGIEKISDLLKLPRVRFVTDEDFLQRPLDGLSALLRRYGITKGESLVEKQKSRLYRTLLEDKVDVAEGFSTDGQIEDFGLTVLRDDLNFFPIYQASPLVRKEALERHPRLRAALEQLAGAIDTETMRKINKAVELDGESFQTVAGRFLVEKGLITTAEAPDAEAEELVLAVAPLDEHGGAADRALRAVRKAFPDRAVTITRTAEPLQALDQEQARLALVGAESFFSLRGLFPVRDEDHQALAVVGYRMAHLLVPEDSEVRTLAQMSTLGVGSPRGSSHRSAEMIVTSLGLEDQVRLASDPYHNVATQVAHLQQGQLDGLLLMAPPGHKRIATLIEQAKLRLLPLSEWKEGNNLYRFPFFRPARIPANTYAEQSQFVETVSVQAVLAGPALRQRIVGNHGPAIVRGANLSPLSDEAIVALNRALGGEEKIDPLLPAAAVLAPRSAAPGQSIHTSPAASFANLVAILLLGYLVYLFVREERQR